jgi:hypothetical protein
VEWLELVWTNDTNLLSLTDLRMDFLLVLYCLELEFLKNYGTSVIFVNLIYLYFLSDFFGKVFSFSCYTFSSDLNFYFVFLILIIWHTRGFELADRYRYFFRSLINDLFSFIIYYPHAFVWLVLEPADLGLGFFNVAGASWLSCLTFFVKWFTCLYDRPLLKDNFDIPYLSLVLLMASAFVTG